MTVNSATDLEAALSMRRWSDVHYWVGGNDLEQEGTFVWESADVLDVEATVWGPGEPNNEYGYEHCVCVDWRSEKLNDMPCTNNNLGFICEKSL